MAQRVWRWFDNASTLVFLFQVIQWCGGGKAVTVGGAVLAALAGGVVGGLSEGVVAAVIVAPLLYIGVTWIEKRGGSLELLIVRRRPGFFNTKDAVTILPMGEEMYVNVEMTAVFANNIQEKIRVYDPEIIWAKGRREIVRVPLSRLWNDQGQLLGTRFDKTLEPRRESEAFTFSFESNWQPDLMSDPPGRSEIYVLFKTAGAPQLRRKLADVVLREWTQGATSQWVTP